jgi:acyl CoA:acetate/3-ketoacid CoA transferase beta subunit
VHPALTADRRVDLIITDMAVIKPTDAGLVLLERAPGVTVEQIVEANRSQADHRGRRARDGSGSLSGAQGYLS